jgi:hypothetical protein
VMYQPYRLLKWHIGGNCDCLADCRCLDYSRDCHGQPVVGCWSTQDEYTQLALQEHRVLRVVVAAVSSFLRGHLVLVPGETGQPGISLGRRRVAGSTTAVPLPRRSCWRYY